MRRRIGRLARLWQVLVFRIIYGFTFLVMLTCFLLFLFFVFDLFSGGDWYDAWVFPFIIFVCGWAVAINYFSKKVIKSLSSSGR